MEFAESLARVDPAGALALTEDLVDPGASTAADSRSPGAWPVATRPGPRVLDSLRDPRALARALPSLCHALAPVDPDLPGN